MWLRQKGTWKHGNSYARTYEKFIVFENPIFKFNYLKISNKTHRFETKNAVF